MINDGPAVGSMWQGEYLLQATLGDPSHGVYRAQRRRDSQPVALRLWRAPDDESARLFVEVASAACSVHHPSLARIEACGREDPYCFLVSEYLVGRKLDTWADQVGIPPLGEVIELMRRICEGLAVAARSGVFHTALHPRNVVMLQGDPATGRRAQPKLLDLGVPSFVRPRAPQPLAAQFMAPEQLASAFDPAQPVPPPASAAMNVYSCGALLYYLCTGGPPYRHGDLAALRDAHLQDRLVLPSRINPQITPSLNVVIVQALAVDSTQRFASVAELGEALARVNLTPSVASARPVLSTVPPRSGSVPPRVSGPPRASALGLKRITTPPPISVPPGIARRPVAPAASEFEPEPDTAKTGALSAITGRPPGALAGADDDVNMSEEREPSVAPAGSFSSQPPPRRSPVPRPLQGIAVAPVASFSSTPQPPSAASPLGRIEPSPVPLDDIHDAVTERPPRGDKARPPMLWLAALAALACAALFGVVRLLGSPPPSTEASPTVTIDDHSAALDDPTPIAAEPPVEATRPPEPPPFPQDPVIPDPPQHDTAPKSSNDPAPTPRGSRLRAPRSSATGAAAPAREPRATPPSPSPSPVPSLREPPMELLEPAPVRPAEVFLPSASAPAPSSDQPTPGAAEAPAHASKQARPTEISKVEPPPPLQPQRVPEPEPVQLPLEARVSIGDVELRGALPTSWVRRAVERIESHFGECYAKAARSAGKNEFGTLTVELELDERGRARSPSARGGKLAGLNECVADAAGGVISERAPDTGTVHASFKVRFFP